MILILVKKICRYLKLQAWSCTHLHLAKAEEFSEIKGVIPGKDQDLVLIF